MIVNYQNSVLEKDISFRYNGWFKDRKNHKNCTFLIWLKTKKMQYHDGFHNQITPILIFLN